MTNLATQIQQNNPYEITMECAPPSIFKHIAPAACDCGYCFQGTYLVVATSQGFGKVKRYSTTILGVQGRLGDYERQHIIPINPCKTCITELDMTMNICMHTCKYNIYIHTYIYIYIKYHQHIMSFIGGQLSQGVPQYHHPISKDIPFSTIRLRGIPGPSPPCNAVRRLLGSQRRWVPEEFVVAIGLPWHRGLGAQGLSVNWCVYIRLYIIYIYIHIQREREEFHIFLSTYLPIYLPIYPFIYLSIDLQASLCQSRTNEGLQAVGIQINQNYCTNIGHIWWQYDMVNSPIKIKVQMGK